MKFSSQLCAVLLAAGANARAIGAEENSGIQARQAPNPLVSAAPTKTTPAAKGSAAIASAPKESGKGLGGLLSLKSGDLAEQASAIAGFYSSLAAKVSGLSTAFPKITKAASNATAVPKTVTSYATYGTPTVGKDGTATVTLIVPAATGFGKGLAKGLSGGAAGVAAGMLDPFGLYGPGILGLSGDNGLIGDIADELGLTKSSPTPKAAKVASNSSAIATKASAKSFSWATKFSFTVTAKTSGSSKTAAFTPKLTSAPAATAKATRFEDDEDED